jgi:hypothetical protein
MNHLLRPRIWPSFLASSGVGSCEVPFRYASEPIPRYRGTVARWHAHLRGLATAIHEISGLAVQIVLYQMLYNVEKSKGHISCG